MLLGNILLAIGAANRIFCGRQFFPCVGWDGPDGGLFNESDSSGSGLNASPDALNASADGTDAGPRQQCLHASNGTPVEYRE